MKMADGRHLANRFFGHNSSTYCLISAKLCTRKQNGMPSMTKKLQISEIQYGGQPPSSKSLNHPISVKTFRILMKFDALQPMLNLMTATRPKIKTFKIQGGRRLPSLKSFFDITQQAKRSSDFSKFL